METVDFDVQKAIEGAIASRSDEDKDEWRKLQEDCKTALSGEQDVDRRLYLGCKTIEFAERQLEVCKDEAVLDQLAEGYALIGDYEKASQIARNEQRRAEYERIRDSFDKEPCDCPKKIKQGTFTQHTEFVKDRFYSTKGVRELIECVTCRRLRC